MRGGTYFAVNPRQIPHFGQIVVVDQSEALLDCFILGVLASNLFSFISILWFCQKMAEPIITTNAAARSSKNAARANATHATAIIVVITYFPFTDPTTVRLIGLFIIFPSPSARALKAGE